MQRLAVLLCLNHKDVEVFFQHLSTLCNSLIILTVKRKLNETKSQSNNQTQTEKSPGYLEIDPQNHLSSSVDVSL